MPPPEPNTVSQILGCRVWWHHTCLLVALLAPAPAISDTSTVDRIVERYRAECEYPFIDEERDDDRELHVPDDAIFDIAITSGSKKATVVFAKFGCTGSGLNWCGSGGCNYSIVVDDVVHFSGFGYPPVAVNTGPGSNQTTLILLGKHSSSCETADGNAIAGMSPCYDVIVWSDLHNSFVVRKR